MSYNKFPIFNFCLLPEKGVSVFFAVMILSVLLAIGLGVSTILVSQIRMVKEMGDSVNSLYAADTGIERVLYEDKMCRLPGCGNLSWSCLDIVNCDDGRAGGTVSGTVGDAAYQVNVNGGATNVSSQGLYRGTRRAVKIGR